MKSATRPAKKSANWKISQFLRHARQTQSKEKMNLDEFQAESPDRKTNCVFIFNF
jgi:hypothetical protein